MIFYTDTYLNAQASTLTPLNHARIGYQTHLLETLPTAINVSSEVEGYPGDAPLRVETLEWWQMELLPATWEVEFGAVVELDYSLLVGFDLAGIDVLLETNNGDVDTDDDFIWEIFARLGNQDDDSPMMFMDTLRQAQRMRYTLTETTDASGEMPKVAVIYAGQMLAMQRPTYSGVTPPMLARATEMYSGMSRNGHFLGQDFKRHGVEPAASFTNLTSAWIHSHFDPFSKAARSRPFAYAWRPSAFPADVVYAWATADIRPANIGKRDLMQVSWGMRGTGRE